MLYPALARLPSLQSVAVDSEFAVGSFGAGYIDFTSEDSPYVGSNAGLEERGIRLPGVTVEPHELLGTIANHPRATLHVYDLDPRVAEALTDRTRSHAIMLTDLDGQPYDPERVKDLKAIGPDLRFRLQGAAGNAPPSLRRRDVWRPPGRCGDRPGRTVVDRMGRNIPDPGDDF